MKTLIRLIGKVFKGKKQVELIEEITEDQFDAWIVSIREKPQLSNISCVAQSNRVNANDDLEAAGNLVLA